MVYKVNENNPINRFRELRKLWSFIIIIFLIIEILLVMKIPSVKATSSTYFEDFISTAYRNALFTNATGWGSGNISIQHENITIVGSYNTPDSARDVVVEGNLAYVADYSGGLQIINISNPKNPYRIGYYSALYVDDVFLSGNYAYLAADHLKIVDISNPANPSFVGQYVHPSSAEPIGVFVSGDYAYVCYEYWGVYILDVRNPASPINVKIIDIGARPKACWVSGLSLFIAYYLDDLEIYNVSYPKNPTLIGATDPGACEDIYIDGDYAYCAIGLGGLSIINITKPKTPSPISSFNTNGFAYDIYVSGDLVFIADDTTGVYIINVTFPKNPTLVATIDTPDSARGVTVVGEHAYVADASTGLQVIRVFDFVQPSAVGNCFYKSTWGAPYTWATGLAVSGDYAFLSDVIFGFVVINISNPKSPKYVTNITTTDWARDIAVAGDYAYLADGDAGLVVFDISNPSKPQKVGFLDTNGYAEDIFISGQLAYLADQSTGMKVINISNPTKPFIIGTVDTPGAAYGVYVSGDYAYIADGYSGFHIVNITNPKNPTIIGSADAGDCARNIAVSGDFTYIASQRTGLSIFNTADPTTPSFVAYYPRTGDYETYDLYLDGQFVDIIEASGDSYLRIINVTDPFNPKHVYSRSFGSFSEGGILVSGEYAYVVEMYSGLSVFEVKPIRTRLYEPVARAQSTPIFTGTDSVIITKANLSTTELKPTGTTIVYYLSPDNGAHWEQVTPNSNYLFSYRGHELIWRAILRTTNPLNTPRIFDLKIIYTVLLNAPDLLSPANASITNNNLPTFDWTDNSGASTYLIQLDTSLNFNSINLINRTVSSSQYTPSTPMADGIWYWRVAANSSAGELGVFSEIWNFKIDATPPATPILLNPQNNKTLNDNTPDFSWTNIPDANCYHLQIDTVLSFDSGNLINRTEFTTTYTPSSPLADALWHWRVRAIDSANNPSPFSAIFNFTIDTIAPPAPVLSSPSNDVVINDNTPTFSWNPAADAQYYIVQIDTALTFNSGNLINRTEFITAYTPVSPLSDTLWHWRVRAIDDGGNPSPFSAIFNFTIDTVPPDTPWINYPQYITTTNNTPTFSWISIADTSYYFLQMDTTPSFNSGNLINRTAVLNSYTPPSPLADTTWYWRVQAVDTGGNHGPFDSRYFTIDSTPPTYTNVTESADPLELGESETINVWGVNDASEITAVLLEFNGYNYSMSPNGDRWSFVISLWLEVGNYSYIIYLCDYWGNWNSTTGAFQVIDSILPTFGFVTENGDPLQLGSDICITIWSVSDMAGIQTVLLEFDGSNHSMIQLGYNSAWTYYNWTPNTTGIYPYKIYIQDNSGNWNSVNGTIEIINPPSAIPIFTLPFIFLGLAILAIFVISKKRIKF